MDLLDPFGAELLKTGQFGGQILSQPVLARLAKIERVAEEVASGGDDGGGGRG